MNNFINHHKVKIYIYIYITLKIFWAKLSSTIKDDKKNLNCTNIGQAGFFSNIAEAGLVEIAFPWSQLNA